MTIAGDSFGRAAPSLGDPATFEISAADRSREKSRTRALDELRRVVGQDHVIDGGEALELATRTTSPSASHAVAVVRPGSVDEVMSCVGVANRLRVPLWPVSQGRNWGYGTRSPVRAGSVIMHLGRLDRILEVNTELAYVVVEPGVTYRRLRAHLEAHHPTLWSDCTDGPPDGSVLGNALDRGLGVTALADHFGSLCGLEVVLPNGDLVRTGGGPTGCPTWNTHKWGVGPYVEGLFTQSNFGIVTKGGVALMPRPERFVSFSLEMARDEHMPTVIEAVRRLTLAGSLRSAIHVVNHVAARAVFSSRRCEPNRAQRPEQRVAPWTLVGSVAGTCREVAASLHEIRKALAPWGRFLVVGDRRAKIAGTLARASSASPLGARVVSKLARLVGASPEELDLAAKMHDLMKGRPSDFFVRHAYFKAQGPAPTIADPARDGVGLLWFAPIVPMTGRSVTDVLALCRPLFARHGFDFYVALLPQNARSVVVLLSIFFDRASDEEARRASALYDGLSTAVAEASFQQYRVGTEGMAHLYEGNDAYRSFLRAMQSALDPAKILAPGRYGV
jgi:4-cresol dehydrogenase (hydroxylating)